MTVNAPARSPFVFRALDRVMRWLAGFAAEPEVSLRNVREVCDMLRRADWRRDDVRIMSRADVDLEALRRRMVDGISLRETAPRKTVLHVVASIWARRSA